MNISKGTYVVVSTPKPLLAQVLDVGDQLKVMTYFPSKRAEGYFDEGQEEAIDKSKVLHTIENRVSRRGKLFQLQPKVMEEIKQYFVEGFKVEEQKEQIVEEEKKEEEIVHIGKRKAKSPNLMPKTKQTKNEEEEKIQLTQRITKREKRIPPETKKRKNISQFDSMYYDKPFPE